MGFKDVIDEVICTHERMIQTEKELREKTSGKNGEELYESMIEEFKKGLLERTGIDMELDFDKFSGFNTGIKVESWKPYAFLSTYNGYSYTNKGYWINWINDEEHVRVDFDGAFLIEYIEDFNKKFGTKIHLSKTTIVEKEDIKKIHDVDELKIVYPDIEILHEGEIWRKGWDIEDIFFITKLDGDYLLFLSINGHGSGIDQIFEKGTSTKKDLENFFNEIEVDDSNNRFRLEYFEKIAENWEI